MKGLSGDRAWVELPDAASWRKYSWDLSTPTQSLCSLVVGRDDSPLKPSFSPVAHLSTAMLKGALRYERRRCQTKISLAMRRRLASCHLRDPRARAAYGIWLSRNRNNYESLHTSGIPPMPQDQPGECGFYEMCPDSEYRFEKPCRLPARVPGRDKYCQNSSSLLATPLSQRSIGRDFQRLRGPDFAYVPAKPTRHTSAVR